MTAVRPEYEGAHGDPGGSYGGDPPPFPRPEAFQAAVDALDDPLNDPLPGAPSPPGPEPERPEAYEPGPYGPGLHEGRADESVSPWFRPHGTVAGRQGGGGPVHAPTAQEETASGFGYANGLGPRGTQPAPPRAEAGHTSPTTAGAPGGADSGEPGSAGVPFADGMPGGAGPGSPLPNGPTTHAGPLRQGRDTETAALRRAEEPAPAPLSVDAGAPFGDDDRRTVGLRRPDTAELGGRAARRKAAQARGRRGNRAAAPEPLPRPASRLEARRAARAASREGLAVLASRVTGEVFISVGVLMLLFVAYQLWWTNVLAGQEAGGAANDLQEQWDPEGRGAAEGKVDPERRAGNFAAGEGFAIMHIPKIDIETPIAEGVSKKEVLDKGLVGHYDQAPLKTGMPWDAEGNFALAGHRNTHGEPFRYINRLVGGDEMVVETADKYYTYKMTNRLASTSPSNTSVIQPVPPQSGFQGEGRYITLTTCTPEFTSKYRLIVWGKMVDERPRSKGKPDALVK